MTPVEEERAKNAKHALDTQKEKWERQATIKKALAALEAEKEEWSRKTLVARKSGGGRAEDFATGVLFGMGKVVGILLREGVITLEDLDRE